LGIDMKLIINTLMNQSQDTIYFKDKHSKVIFSSKAHAAFWGVNDPLEAVGKTDFDYFPKSFAQPAYEDEQTIIATGKPIIGRVEKLTKPDGKVTWISASKHPFYNLEGEIIGTWGTSRDITSLKKAEEELILVNQKLEEANRQLRILSARDSLSGLYNHRYFCEELEKTFNFYKRQKEKEDSKDFALIILDIDDFKNVNDTYGHLMGDFVIKHLAETMLGNIRQSDSCFRYGGDEFAILLLDTDRSKAIQIAEKLRSIVEKTPIISRDTKISITTSMGVASFSDAKTPKGLISKADERLYLSKNAGKNKVR